MRVDLMEFLYRVMEELSNAGIPIVFKGAMVLNLIIRENNPSKVERMTRDIDGDCDGGNGKSIAKCGGKSRFIFRRSD